MRGFRGGEMRVSAAGHRAAGRPVAVGTSAAMAEERPPRVRPRLVVEDGADGGKLLGNEEAEAAVDVIGRANKAGSATLRTVSWKVDSVPNSGRNCFGRFLRAPHSRVPAPPHMIRGMIG